VVKKSSLAETHPELASQAVGWDPENYSRGSDKKVSWSCERGHNWMATISSRVSGNGCPVCSGHKILAGFNDLATTHPKLAEEADGWDATTIAKGSHKKLGWVCYFGHKWSAEVKSRALIGAGCPYCDGRLAVTGVNDLETLYPDIAAQARGWDPSKVNPASHKKREFECHLGHRYVQGVRRRVEATGCPVCQNDQVLVGFNDLATTHPGLAVEADGWDPKTVVAGTSNKKQWRCANGHQWSIGVHARAVKGNGCPYCSGRHAIAGETDIATTHPQIASQLVDDHSTAIKGGTNKKVKWKCGRGHLWMATPASRTVAKTGCPFCSGQKAIEGETDLFSTHPDLAAQARGWNPSEFTKGSEKKARWECELGHEWVSTISSRVSGVGCPVCAGRQIVKGFNDLATTHPTLALEADGWDVNAFGFKSSKIQPWICDQGHRYKSKIHSRTYMKSGCPSCAKTGFDQNQPAWLYFIENLDLNMFQIGITNFPDQRLGKHAKTNWNLREIRGPLDGFLTRRLETSCLHALVKRGAILGHKAGVAKFDGYTEAWTKSSLTVTTIKQILDWVYEDELDS
jgi:hypothetical protein